jgi:hypothetical protein
MGCQIDENLVLRFVAGCGGGPLAMWHSPVMPEEGFTRG